MVKTKKPKKGVAGLAEALGFTRQSFYDWKIRFKDSCPTGDDVEQWRRFIEENQLGVVGNRVEKPRENLMQEKLTQEIRLLKTKNAKEEKSVVDRGEMDELLLHISTLQRTILHQRLGRELGPKCEGKNAAEMNVFGRQLADELCDIFSGKIDQWRST